jgi:hypothetical protein
MYGLFDFSAVIIFFCHAALVLALLLLISFLAFYEMPTFLPLLSIPDIDVPHFCSCATVPAV